jgi:hypothetical protein
MNTQIGVRSGNMSGTPQAKPSDRSRRTTRIVRLRCQPYITSNRPDRASPITANHAYRPVSKLARRDMRRTCLPPSGYSISCPLRRTATAALPPSFSASSPSLSPPKSSFLPPPTSNSIPATSLPLDRLDTARVRVSCRARLGKAVTSPGASTKVWLVEEREGREEIGARGRKAAGGEVGGALLDHWRGRVVRAVRGIVGSGCSWWLERSASGWEAVDVRGSEPLPTRVASPMPLALPLMTGGSRRCPADLFSSGCPSRHQESVRFAVFSCARDTALWRSMFLLRAKIDIVLLSTLPSGILLFPSSVPPQQSHRSPPVRPCPPYRPAAASAAALLL